MDDNHILKLRANPYQVIKCLDGILSPGQTQLIKNEIYANVKQLLRLAQSHLRFATTASGNDSWRQKVSRAYYACYLASCAVRLAISGVYSTDVNDHKKVGQLPSDFPNNSTWCNFLTTLRADRNMADYDHSARASSLEMPGAQYIQETQDFITAVKDYLRSKGVIS